eukprot:335984-Chlamydomonas_euryale.AAC.1
MMRPIASVWGAQRRGYAGWLCGGQRGYARLGVCSGAGVLGWVCGVGWSSRHRCWKACVEKGHGDSMGGKGAWRQHGWERGMVTAWVDKGHGDSMGGKGAW